VVAAKRKPGTPGFLFGENTDQVVIPAKAGKRTACGEFRGTAIQLLIGLGSRFCGNDKPYLPGVSLLIRHQ
jgi:hypothetical protein